jgi:hypothetical protein
VTGIQVNPLERLVGEEPGSGHRPGDHQRYRVAVPAIEDVPVQRAGERTTALRCGGAMIVLAVRAFRPAAATPVDSDQDDALAAELHELGEGAEASAEVGPDLDEAAVLRKPFDGLFLAGSPPKPAFYLLPMHARLRTVLTLSLLSSPKIRQARHGIRARFGSRFDGIAPLAPGEVEGG